MSDIDGLDGLESGLTDIANQMKTQQTPQPASPTPSAPPPVPSSTRKGNEVFSQPQAPQRAPQGGPEVIRHEDVSMREFGYEIPVDAVPLPSQGKIYSPNHPLCNAERVFYRGMTAKQEDILMSPMLIKKGTVISELIKSCLVNKDIDVGTLISGDRNALMVAIRMSGYGRDYQTTYDCPSCGHKNNPTFDLADLDIKFLELEPVSPGENCFHFELPVSKARIEFKFLTGAEEEEAIREVDIKRKKGLANSNVVTTRLSKSIVSVNGDRSGSKVMKFVNVMPARDSLVLRKFIDKHEPGVDMTVEFECENCDHFDNIQMPMGAKFFWPES